MQSTSSRLNLGLHSTGKFYCFVMIDELVTRGACLFIILSSILWTQNPINIKIFSLIVSGYHTADFAEIIAKSCTKNLYDSFEEKFPEGRN